MSTSTSATSMASALAYDGTAMLGRHLRRLRHNPGLLVLTQSMPITMLLFFGYVLGSALAMPGEEYRAFLVPGLLVATAANGIMTGMFQAAQDTHRGVTDRLRTLPISRAAVPSGRHSRTSWSPLRGPCRCCSSGSRWGGGSRGRPCGRRGRWGCCCCSGSLRRGSGSIWGCCRGVRRRRASWGARLSSCRCCRTRTSRRPDCRVGCEHWPIGTRSAR